MTIREQAKKVFGFEVVGRLTRMKDTYFGVQYSHYPLWMDEAGNEYDMSADGKTLECIVTADGGVM